MRNITIICVLIALVLYSAYVTGQHRCLSQKELYERAKRYTPDLDRKIALQKAREREAELDGQSQRTTTTKKVNVVVHVIYKTAAENISLAQIESQITALNKDFSATNADISNVPSAFSGLIGNPNFVFELKGVTRKSTTKSSFTISDDDEKALKLSMFGGTDAWPPDRYLNIWVCNISGPTLGYAYGSAAAGEWYDGVVISYKAFGTMGTVTSPNHLGRTATHEIGHYFDLNHIWGDDEDETNKCSRSDGISDTPNQSVATYGCPSFPLYDACTPSGNGVMFMNYMDYVDDNCMHMFTAGQVTVMRNTYNNHRPNLGANVTSLVSSTSQDHLFVYPNPFNEQIIIEGNWTTVEPYTFKLVNQLGVVVYSSTENMSEYLNKTINLSHLQSGIYYLIIENSIETYTKKLVKK
ncbi:MAG: M43 family zinc metalloprotease [Cytophagaceae bacterium]|nr:M43 family zinc metalloprotease [Cytophagaceae bacterium]MDW8455165.1 M43 family zinc metalloprotease [Cytophagaceae bacterium]